MNAENTQKLCRDFPALYGTDFAFSCGDGWMELIYHLSRALVDHAHQADLHLVITDVKEKHASLRFYAEGTDATADRLIELAEMASETIPEQPR